MSRFIALSSAFLLLWSGLSFADAKVGDKAPEFTLKDSNGKTVSLKDFAGKQAVVLEWYNKDCPFVRKHYDGPHHKMQSLQQKAKEQNVAWFMVSSAKKGKEGWETPADINKTIAKEAAVPAGFLIDADGKVGKAYGAKTTPHMFIIDKEGKVAYAGAIDNMPTTEVEDVTKAENFVEKALAQMKANEPVKVATNNTHKAYGCSVKY